VIATADIPVQPRDLLAEDRWTGKTLLAAGMQADAFSPGMVRWVGRSRPLPRDIKETASNAFIAGEFTAEEMPMFYS